MTKRSSHHGVVVGADGSPASLVAVEWAARAAAMRHVPLDVVHVVSPLSVAASALAWPAGRVPQEVLENTGERWPQGHRRSHQSGRRQRDWHQSPEIDSEMLLREIRTGPC